jgi:hypothetical protein
MPEITALAAQFDARNGTTSVGDQLKRRLDQPPLVDQLVLSEAAAPVRSARPAPNRHGSRQPGQRGPAGA